jgi:concanavalin A-like lectin/glucanase superfamily protein
VGFRDHTAAAAIALAMAAGGCEALSGLNQFNECANCEDGGPPKGTVESGIHHSPVPDASAETESGPTDDAGSRGQDAMPADADADATDAASAEGDAAPETGAIDASDAGDLASGLIAFYKFDETSGTSAADSSGNNHTATLAGGATFGAGLQNNAVTLSGNNQYVSLPTGIVNGLSTISITAWVKLTMSPQWNRIFDFGNDTSTYMFLTANSGSTLRFSITTGGATMEQQMNATSLPTGTWEHVALTLSGGMGVLYVQGAQVAQSATFTFNPSSLGNTMHNWLGRSQYAADPYLNGQIDNVRIYSRAISAGEVQALYMGDL